MKMNDAAILRGVIFQFGGLKFGRLLLPGAGVQRFGLVLD
jgi:hypothetical protein